MNTNNTVEKSAHIVAPELAKEYAEDAKENLTYVDDAFYRLSIQGGRYKVEGNIIGNEGIKFQAVILKIMPVNLYYESRYDPSNPAMPDCWSIGGEKPDQAVAKKQSDYCIKCKNNRFGSAESSDGKRRGKACNNTRRLVLKVEGVDLPVVLSLPPSSIKSFNKFLKELSSGEIPIPVFGVMTEFSFDTTVQYPKPIMRVASIVSPDKYKFYKEYRTNAVVEKALTVYTTSDIEHVSDDVPF